MSFMTDKRSVPEWNPFSDDRTGHCGSIQELSTSLEPDQNVGMAEEQRGFQTIIDDAYPDESWRSATRQNVASVPTANGVQLNDVVNRTAASERGWIPNQLSRNPAHLGKEMFFPVEGVDVSNFSEMLPVNTCGKMVMVNGKNIALFFIDGRFYAVDEQCPHLGGPLHLGDIEDMAGMESPRVVCPWHKWCFELATGRLIRPAWKHQDIQSYPVITNSLGQIFIGFSSIDPTCFIQDPDF